MDSLPHLKISILLLEIENLDAASGEKYRDAMQTPSSTIKRPNRPTERSASGNGAAVPEEYLLGGARLVA